MIVLSIDPGNVDSAYCFIDSDSLKPESFEKTGNALVRAVVDSGCYDVLVIERVASYGMAVGKDVFQTCEWIGRFTEAGERAEKPIHYIYRRDEKLHICGDSRAKDANIKQALVERFARHDFKQGKGTKARPDFFYGFKADVWQAYATGLVYIETRLK